MTTFPKSVLRSRTFCPEKFEGNLQGALEVTPDCIEYMYLNGVVWWLPFRGRTVDNVIDTGLRYKDIIQDVKDNKVLSEIRALME